MNPHTLFRRIPMPLLKLAAPVVLRTPTSGLAVQRLYAYLDELHATRDVDGAVVEIGCHLGGTSAIAYKFLRQIESERRYQCIDTFAGFVPSQFETDSQNGVPEEDSELFSHNSISLVRKLLDMYGTPEIELVEGDICAMDLSVLPDVVSVGLVDVDLAEPISASLDALYPRMAPGGVLLVDDCPEKTSWAGARPEYLRWVAEHGLEPDFAFGFGRIRIPRASD